MSARPIFRKILSFVGATTLAGGMALTAAGTAASGNPNNPPTTGLSASSYSLGAPVDLTDKCPQGLMTGTQNPAAITITSILQPTEIDYTVTPAFGSKLDACILVGNGTDLTDPTQYTPMAAGTWNSDQIVGTDPFDFSWTLPLSLRPPSQSENICLLYKAQANPANESDRNNPPQGARKVATSECFQINPPAPPGTLRIIKDANPEGSTSFPFSVAAPGDSPTSFSLVDNGQPGSKANYKDFTVTEGTFTVSEDNVSGWTQGTPVCDTGEDTKIATITPPSGEKTASVELNFDSANQSATCTFFNSKPPSGTLTIIKHASPASGTEFPFSDNINTDDSPDTFSLSVGGQNPVTQKVFTGLGTGTYEVAEGAPQSPWTQQAPACTVNAGSASSQTFAPGDTIPGDETAAGAQADVSFTSNDADVTCVFTNTVPTAPPQVIPTYGISITKDGPTLAHVGDPVTYSMAVKATTNYPLTNVKVTDPSCTSGPTLVSKVGGNQDASLDPGETWNYTCTRTVLSTDSNPFVNTATASSDQASATATHSVTIIHPAISVTKTANPTSGTAGTLITYTFVVTNTGDTTLNNVTVSDDHLGTIGNVAVLGPGASTTLTKTFTLGSSAVTNVVTAQGTDVLGKTVSATASATVSVVSPFVAPTTTTTTVPPTTTTTTVPPPAVPVKVLPFTGAGHSVRDLFGGAALMVLGGLMLVIGRRRRPAADKA